MLRFLKQIDSSNIAPISSWRGPATTPLTSSEEPDNDLVQRLMQKMRESGIEFRRGSAGGGNQIRPTLFEGIVPDGHHYDFPETEHVHFYGFYIGNFPNLRMRKWTNYVPF